MIKTILIGIIGAILLTSISLNILQDSELSDLESKNSDLGQEIIWFNEMNDLKRNGNFGELKEKISIVRSIPTI